MKPSLPFARTHQTRAKTKTTLPAHTHKRRTHHHRPSNPTQQQSQAAKKQQVRDFLKSKVVPRAIAMRVHNFYNYAASKEVSKDEQARRGFGGFWEGGGLLEVLCFFLGGDRGMGGALRGALLCRGGDWRCWRRFLPGLQTFDSPNHQTLKPLLSSRQGIVVALPRKLRAKLLNFLYAGALYRGG